MIAFLAQCAHCSICSKRPTSCVKHQELRLDQPNSHRILCDPLTRGRIMLSSVAFEERCDFWHQGIVWVAICEQGRHGEQNLRDCECRAPLILQDVEADRAVRIHIAVVDLCCEMYLRWLE